MSLSIFRLRRLPLAVLALAGGAAFGARVPADLAVEAARDGRVDALIVFKDQAAPALARRAPGADHKARRRALVDALRQRADVQQSGLRAWLAARGIEHRAFWIANLVHARLSAAELAALATHPDIARIEPNPRIAVPLPRHVGSAAAEVNVASIAWGVDKINAPKVWAEGHTGAGVVIGGEDTGFHWQHPALKPQYRGWNGSTADHHYNWHDAIHSPNGACPADSPQPCDDHGHGTHTAGTFAGDDQGTHQIGVAPGAKWVGCRNMNAGNGTPASYIECMQWMLAPTDLQGKNPDPDRAPDVIGNSWTCTEGEGCTVGNEIQAAVGHLTSAGILFVAAAANYGPGCGSITDPPATYATAFTIGATDANDVLADFSSRGPVQSPQLGSKHVKPDVSAPGVAVYSAWPPASYGSLNGTSMATPHVAGAAALLMSAVPALKGNPKAVARLLRDTAVTRGVTNPVKQACGGTRRSDWPNHMVGHGRIDVYAAYQAALAGAFKLDDDEP